MSFVPPAPPRSVDDLARVTPQGLQALLAGGPAQALPWVSAAARLGLAEAQAVLGQWLLDGHGVARDAVAAFQWFLKAARQGHAMGMTMAGRCLENGWGTAPDLVAATGWYQQAAERGLDVGMYNYANQLASGKAVPQDHRKALGWYSQAASLGHAKSMTKAGRYFEDGLVVPQDLSLAFSSYRQAAEGGDFRGQFCYAGMLAAQGQVEQALHWLRKVPETATPGFMAEAGRLLLDSPHEAVRQVGQDMLDRVTHAG
ncbi:MAG: sel1 repeat family protein [Ramlibacter sp.]|nr:sel1 repeat family protein [Ramlibacter sp.]